MPSFEISSPDGAKYQIDAPDQNQALQAVMSMHGQQQSAPVTWGGVGKAAGSGVVRGAGALADTPSTLSWLADAGPSYLIMKGAEKLGLLPEGKTAEDAVRDAQAAFPSQGPSITTPGANIVNALDKAGALHTPQNKAEEWAQTAGEFAPMIAGGEGGLIKRGVQQVLLPAAGSQIAGDVAQSVTDSPILQNVARTVGALAGGLPGAISGARSTAEQAIQKAFKDIPPDKAAAIADQAQSLMTEAQSRGVSLTWAEAFQQASGGSTGLGTLQRISESMGGLRDTMAERPAQVQAAGRQAIDTISPPTQAPSTIGPQVGDAAKSVVADTNANIARQSGMDQVSGPVPSVPGLMERPAVASAMNEAAETAANEGRPLPVITRNEAGQPVTNDAVEQFQAGSRQRLDTALGQAFGNAGQLATGDAIVAQRAAAATPLYDAARAAVIPTDAMPTELLRRLRFAGALPQAIQKARVAGEPFDISNVDTWDRMKRALDDRIAAAQRKGANDDVRIYTGLKNEVTNAIDAAVPEYAQARAAFAGHSEFLDALAAGRDAAGDAVPAEVVRREFGPLTPGEQDMYRLGMGNALREKLAKAGNTANLPATISSNQLIRDKMGAVLPRDRLATLNGALANEAQQFTSALSPDARAWARTHQVLEQRAASATGPKQEGIVAARDAVRQAATGNPQLSQAMALQDQLRATQLEPLMQGPIGRLAKSDPTTSSAVNALFGEALPGSEKEVGDAISALHAKNPIAARQLVRSYVEGVFNRATSDLQGGPNQFGGANFAKEMAGNPQVAANLDAALRALPNGDTIADGFMKFMDVMKATGQRQRLGSLTAFNTEALKTLEGGSKLRAAGSVAAGAGAKIPAILRDKYLAWSLGKNLNELAGLMVDPEAGALFKQLATTASGSGKAAAIAARLIFLAVDGGTANKRR
jgi:hypothetical protein